MAADLKNLIERVKILASYVDELCEIQKHPELRRQYLRWYSQAQLLVGNHAKSMSNEFKSLYYSAQEGESESDAWQYKGIRSYLRTTEA